METLDLIPVPHRTCIVAGSGPSLPDTIADILGINVSIIAVNDAYRILPSASILYATDTDWWLHNKGAVDFLGKKWTTHSTKPVNSKAGLPKEWGLKVVQGRRGDTFSTDRYALHYGSLSGFTAINLALLLGYTRVLLAGFDMHGTHYFGDHGAPLRNVDPQRYLSSFTTAAAQLPPNVEIINCTPGTMLRAFPLGELRSYA